MTEFSRVETSIDISENEKDLKPDMTLTVAASRAAWQYENPATEPRKGSHVRAKQEEVLEHLQKPTRASLRQSNCDFMFALKIFDAIAQHDR